MKRSKQFPLNAVSKRRCTLSIFLPLSLSLSLPLSLSFLLMTCASTSGPATRYPPRRPGCALAVFRTPVPGVAAWDDLGIAEAVCHIDTAQTECLRRLYAEACRMGGDIIYNLPRRPARPRDQAMLFRGQVAHSKTTPPKPTETSEDVPPAATAEEAAGPVVPFSAGAAKPNAAPLPSLPGLTLPRQTAARADADAGATDATDTNAASAQPVRGDR